MLVQDVMSRSVVTIRAQEAAARARSVMDQTGLHQLVVLDGRRHVVGVIAVADLHEVPDTGRIADFMPPRLFIVRPETSIGAAAALMRDHAIGSLPVLDRNRLVGIVTVSDLLDIVDAEGDRLLTPRSSRRP